MPTSHLHTRCRGYFLSLPKSVLKETCTPAASRHNLTLLIFFNNLYQNPLKIETSWLPARLQLKLAADGFSDSIIQGVCHLTEHVCMLIQPTC